MTQLQSQDDYDYFEALDRDKRMFLWNWFWKKYKDTMTWTTISFNGYTTKYCILLSSFEQQYRGLEKSRLVLLEKQLKITGKGWMGDKNFKEEIDKAAFGKVFYTTYGSPTVRPTQVRTAREYSRMSDSSTLYNLSLQYSEFKAFALGDFDEAYQKYREKKVKACNQLNKSSTKKRVQQKKAMLFNVPEQQKMAQATLLIYLNKIMNPLGMSLSRMTSYSYGGAKKFVDFVDFDWTGPKKHLLEINAKTIDRTGEKLREAMEDALGSNYIEDLITSENDTLRRFAVIFGGNLSALGNLDKSEKIRLAAKVLSEREVESE